MFGSGLDCVRFPAHHAGAKEGDGELGRFMSSCDTRCSGSHVNGK